MNTSSTEYWDIDGVPLNTYCWAIKSSGGTRKSLPTLRGDNRMIPFRPGRRFSPKMPDSKVITLAMWVAGIDPDTDLPSSHDQLVQWNDNWDTLRRLVWTPGREVTLTRRWWMNAASPVLVTASARAQIAGPMEPTMTGRTRADFVIDFLLADPFFYGDELNVSVPANTDVVVNNPGDSAVAYSYFDIQFVGPLTNPLLINNTNGVWCQLNTLISNDTSVNVNVANYKAERSNTGVSVATTLIHGGARQWMVLAPGDNVLRLESSGSGAATLKFRPAYV